jgi:hypothetical protein
VREGAVVDALGDAVAGSQAMKDPAEEPLDGGASTHRWSRVPMRGPAVAPSLSPIRSHLALIAAWKRGGSGENECARVWQREPSVGFVRAENLRDRRI